jgi:hypothetical protein
VSKQLWYATALSMDVGPMSFRQTAEHAFDLLSIVAESKNEQQMATYTVRVEARRVSKPAWDGSTNVERLTYVFTPRHIEGRTREEFVEWVRRGVAENVRAQREKKRAEKRDWRERQEQKFVRYDTKHVRESIEDLIFDIERYETP